MCRLRCSMPCSGGPYRSPQDRARTFRTGTHRPRCRRFRRHTRSRMCRNAWGRFRDPSRSRWTPHRRSPPIPRRKRRSRSRRPGKRLLRGAGSKCKRTGSGHRRRRKRCLRGKCRNRWRSHSQLRPRRTRRRAGRRFWGGTRIGLGSPVRHTPGEPGMNHNRWLHCIGPTRSRSSQTAARKTSARMHRCRRGWGRRRRRSGPPGTFRKRPRRRSRRGSCRKRRPGRNSSSARSRTGSPRPRPRRTAVPGIPRSRSLRCTRPTRIRTTHRAARRSWAGTDRCRRRSARRLRIANLSSKCRRRACLRSRRGCCRIRHPRRRT